MADETHLDILRSGVDAWNHWRSGCPEIEPDLAEAVLIRAPLEGARLAGANLHGAQLLGARLGRACLRRARLQLANLHGADLRQADLREANLEMVNLCDARLDGADLTGALAGATIFGNLDLRNVRGLETLRHRGPSHLGIDTLYRSDGRLPPGFLRGCGLPEPFAARLPFLLGADPAAGFCSCFISYSHRDQSFAEALHARLRAERIRVWFAPEDAQGGRKLFDQIDHAIQEHDRLLLVLSDHSLGSEWVRTEIRRALRAEAEQGRRKLFPIRLGGFEALRSWSCFDADSGRDLAIEVREYFIPDFSRWQEPEELERSVVRLLRDLRAEAPAQRPDRASRSGLSPM